MTATALHLVPTPAPATVAVHPLVAACTGTPMLLTDADVDLIAFANAIPDVIGDTDPDNCFPAQMVLHWYVNHVMEQRRCKGTRAEDLASAASHWVIPFLDELDAAAHPAKRGIANLTFLQGEKLVRSLEGNAPLPAATVAATTLRRSPLACLWLTIPDAEKVTANQPGALRAAMNAGEVVSVRDGDGHRLVRTATLRSAGLLDERDKPHGLAKDSADNVLYVLKQTVERATNLGATLRGNFDALSAVKPLPRHRLRAPRIDAGYQSVATIRLVAAHLSVLDQIILWMLRLTGFRIGEGYGPLVRDLQHTEDGAYTLPVDKQGGQKALVSNPETGLLEPADSKPDTKTPQSTRLVRLPDVIGVLLEQVIAIYHTAPDRTVNLDARLIPGLGKEDTSGVNSFADRLDKAIARAGVQRFTPHDLRGMLITDLKNAGVEERVQEHYTGHLDSKRTEHKKYDDGVPLKLQFPVTDAIAALLDQAGITDLITATTAVEHWGTKTTRHGRRDQICEDLRSRGWLLDKQTAPNGARLLTSREVAARLELSETEVRRRCVRGELPAAKYPNPARKDWMVWKIAEDDFEAWLAAQPSITVDFLAAELGLTYHQTYALVHELVEFPEDRTRGQSIALSVQQAASVREEVARRRAAAVDVIDLPSAAHRLRLPLGQVEKLVRNGGLDLAASPTGSRRRYVTIDSVERFETTRVVARSRDDGRVVPFKDVCAALGLTRPRAGELVSMGVLAATTVDRRQCVLLPSAIAYAEANKIRGARRALQEAALRRDVG